MKFALIHFNLTTESGDPKHMLSIAQGLTKLGHEVVIYCAEFKAEACFPRLNQGLDIRVVPPIAPLASLRDTAGIWGKITKRARQVRVYNDLAKRIAEKLPRDLDFIVCENDYSYKIPSYYKTVNPNAKAVWIMHNPPFFQSAKKNIVTDILSRCVTLFEKISAKRYGAFIDWILVFDEHARELAEMVGPPVKIARLPVDVEHFYSSEKRSIAAGKSIGLLSLGALSPARRYEDTISAAAMLRKRGYDVRVTLICKDYWGDKNYRKEFEKFIEASGIQQYVDARFGGTTEEELLRLMQANDIFVLPNNIKLWAIGAFEAMAVGLPLIASRATAVVEILRDEENALLVDPLRPEQIAEKAELLLGDPLLYGRISEAGKELVKEKLSIEGYIREMVTPKTPQ